MIFYFIVAQKGKENVDDAVCIEITRDLTPQTRNRPNSCVQPNLLTSHNI